MNLSAQGIADRREFGMTILAPAAGKPLRRVLFVNSYGGAKDWACVKQGQRPSHHLWGCVELARMGYEVALAEPVKDFSYRYQPLPHDFRLLKAVRSWLRKDDIIYCGHNVLFWIPFLNSLGLFRRKLVSLLYAEETLDFPGAHRAIIALTPPAAVQAAKLAPKAKVAHLGWGADLNSYPLQPYDPRYVLHCGISGRDFNTLHAATMQGACPVRMLSTGKGQLRTGLAWPTHVDVARGNQGREQSISFGDLVHEHYAGAAASLVVTIPTGKEHALGFTNLMEALAMGKPIIHTRTGALADEIDVDAAGCGIGVPPEDPAALAAAMESIMRDPARAAALGATGRKLCETHYNMDRYANGLHTLFESL